MASLALDPAYRPIEVDEFLDMDLGDAKAELVDGAIYMMAGGGEPHARIAANLIAFLLPRLRGSGCRPYGSDIAVRTGERSIRFPDVSIYCNNPSAPENRLKKLLGDPVVVVEVLSPSTRNYDQRVKLDEYRELAGVQEIVLVDPEAARIRHVRRSATGWQDDWLPAGTDLMLDALNVAIPAADIFDD